MLHGVRFASPDDRVAVAEQITELAVARSVLLTPPSLHHTPERYFRPDGSSRLRPKNHLLYTTATLLDAETRLLEVARETAGPRVSVAIVATGRRGEPAGPRLRAEHRPGARRREDRHLRTRARRARRPGRHRQVDRHGGAADRLGGRRRSGVGDRSRPLGRSRSGARDELGIETENTAKWLTEWRRIPELSARRDRSP